MKTFVCDAYGTVFDNQTHFEGLFETEFPGMGKRLQAQWKETYTEQIFVSSHHRISNSYQEVIRESLVFILKKNQILAEPESILRILNGYHSLPPFPDFLSWRQESVRVILYSNGTQEMLQKLKSHPSMAEDTEFLASENSGYFKPSPNAYSYIAERVGGIDDFEFLSSNRWDVLGAAMFGLRTIWLNRGGGEFYRGRVQPGRIVKSFGEVCGRD